MLFVAIAQVRVVRPPDRPGAVDPNSTAATVMASHQMEDVLNVRSNNSRKVTQPAFTSRTRRCPASGPAKPDRTGSDVPKAEKEGTVPTDDDVNAEFNKRKTESRLSAEQFQAEMEKIGETEASARLAIRKA